MERPQDGGGEEKERGILSLVFPSRRVRPDGSLTCNNLGDVDGLSNQHLPTGGCGVGWSGGLGLRQAPAAAGRSKFSAG